MTIHLDHLMVPCRDRLTGARQLAQLLGVPWSAHGIGPFAAVYVSAGLTLDFDEWPAPLPRLHYCFRVSEADFDAILARIRAAGIACRSGPHGPDDGVPGTAFGGRTIYWNEPDGHMWEMLTHSYARQPVAA